MNSVPDIKNKKNRITADGEADRIMELQRSLTGKSKASSVLITALCALIIYGFAAAFAALPDKDFSEEENRVLSKMPSFSAEALISGEFTSDFASYMADQFPMRNAFIGLKGAAEIAMLKGENNSVILGHGGQLAVREDYPDEDALRRNVSAASAFAEYAESLGTPVVFAAAGRVADTKDEALPALYGTDCQDRIWSILENDCADAGLPVLSLREPLRAKAAAGEYVYYRTDHHWTTQGAFYAACEVNDALGGEPIRREDFTAEAAATDFLGTTWSKAGMRWIGGDTIEYYRWDGDDAVMCSIADDGRVIGLYDRAALNTKDKYASFIGGNNGLTEIESPDAGGRLLVIKDSFFHSMAPIMAKNWNMTVVDLRYYGKPVKLLLDEGGYDGVLILQNMETLTNSTDLEKLRMGMR